MQAKQAVEAAAKAADKAAKGGAAPALEDDSNEETDPTKYYENRVRAVVAAKARGENPYPHKFHVSIQLPAYVAAYGGLEAGQQAADVTVSLAGRVVRKAASGAKLIFFDLRSEGAKIQVMADARWVLVVMGADGCLKGADGRWVLGALPPIRPNPACAARPPACPPTPEVCQCAKLPALPPSPLSSPPVSCRNFGGEPEAFQRLMNSVKRGDIVGVQGFPGKSKKGELSVFPTSMQVGGGLGGGVCEWALAGMLACWVDGWWCDHLHLGSWACLISTQA